MPAKNTQKNLSTFIKRTLQLPRLGMGLLAIALLFLTLGLFWLFLLALFFAGAYLLFTANWRSVRWLRRHPKLYALGMFALVFCASIAARVFLVEVYHIPSGSMENTLLPGDRVVVSKLNYGPRLPQSPLEIPWLNVAFFLVMPPEARAETHWDYHRLNGIARVAQGDVMVFNYPDDEKSFFVKRCTALPGDTLQIVNGEILTNRQTIAAPEGMKAIYDVSYHQATAFHRQLDSLAIPYFGYRSRKEKNTVSLTLTTAQKRQLARAACVDTITREVAPADTVAKTYPWNKQFLWSPDNLGPLIIPQKDMKIPLNPSTFALYKKALDYFEKAGIEQREGKYYQDEQEVTTYTFRQNYYFTMGDNRPSSMDSRFWGFVPESYIVGKAAMVIFSTGSQGIRWKRFLKIIY
ncbi:signal peptidase I [Rapidithrix thailandica]|uniref:Signal peptidase I n=1 Tax=Rapidithrix thailandica TaxID=413964 RepID=A0AAW9SBG7_9BACT